jgi:hypothetical protein
MPGIPRHAPDPSICLGVNEQLDLPENRKLCRCIKRAIGLSPEAPHRLSESLGRNIAAALIHLSSTITMRDDAGVRHAVTKGVKMALPFCSWFSEDFLKDIQKYISDAFVRLQHRCNFYPLISGYCGCVCK